MTTAPPLDSALTHVALPIHRATRHTRMSLVAHVSLKALAALVTLAAPASRARAQEPVNPQDTASRVLSLGDAARLALHQSASAQAARTNAQQATAQLHQKRGGFLPTIYGLGQETEAVQNSAALLRFPPLPPGSPFNFNTFLPPGGVDFPPIKAIDMRAYASDTLFNFGALQRYRQAHAAEQAEYAVASSTAESAANTAASAYLAALQASAVLSARLADSSLAADLLGIADQQLQAGVGITLDVTRAKAQLASTRAQLIAARNDRDRTQLDLLRALGLSLDAHVTLSDSLGRMPSNVSYPPEPQEIERALRQRPDLRAIDEQLTAAQEQVSAIRAERLPSIAAFGSQGVQGGNFDRLLNVYQWGIGVSVPVFDGFRRESRIEEQEAVHRGLQIRRRDLRQQAAIDVRRAFLDLTSAQQQLDAANQQLALVQQELDEARERFRAGVAGNADVITASLDLTNARTLQVNALAGYQAARVSLARATGTVTELP